MQRRELIARHRFDYGYQDSVNPIFDDSPTWADGSCNQLALGEAVIRPFQGFHSKGAGTGSSYMTALGSTWGGLKSINISNKTFTSSDVNTTSDTITVTGHGYVTGVPFTLTTGGTLPTPLVIATTYYVIRVDANVIQVASSALDAASNIAINLTAVGAGTSTINVASVTVDGRGSLLQDYSDTIFTIGSGKVSREGTNITVSGTDVSASTILQVVSKRITDTTYTYIDSAGLGRVDAPTVIVPTSAGGSYTGLINGAVNFKIAAMRDRANVGVDIDNPNAPVKGLASTASAVVVPNNKTVTITFPPALTGQTHWAIWSTKEGFGGTGVFYRLGWRTSSDAGATWYFGVSETTVAAATDRKLEFDYRTGDLLPETEWIYDYPPPAGTHCVRLENIMVVLGCYNGTVGAVSLPNFFENYNPYHLLYFPETVTAVLHRQIDNYAFIACRNSIHVIQYVGYRGDELPSATISTVTPEVGIAYQHNWCLGGGNIAMWIDGAGIALMNQSGAIDFEFGKEVSYFTRNWAAANVVVTFNPTTRSFVFGHADESVSFCLQSGRWSAPVYTSDYGITGNWLSGINARGELVVSLANGTAHTAYSYDNNTSTTRAPVCSIGRWQTTNSPARGNAIYEAQGNIRQGNTAEPLVIGFHNNLFKTFVRGCSVTSGSAVITAPSATFTSEWTGKMVAIFGLNIRQTGNNIIIARITYVSPTTVTMTNPQTGSAQNAGASLTGCFMLVGHSFFSVTPTANRDQHLYSVRPQMMDSRSFCVSLWQPTDAASGAVFGIDIFGTGTPTSTVNK